MTQIEETPAEIDGQQTLLLAEILEALKSQDRTMKKIQEDLFTIRRTTDGLKTIAGQPLMDEVRDAFRGKQLGFMETLEAIADESLSFARFGDGELRSMFRPEFSIYFQKNSAGLASDLKAAMAASEAPNLLVGLPNIFSDHLHWNVVLHEVWFYMQPFVQELPRFGNLHVTRPASFQSYGMGLVEAWRRIWDGKEALIITGRGSRFDLAPGLFDNLKSSRFLYGLPRDTYTVLDEVERAALDAPENLVLISLGPSGSVLAHRLAKAGKQALDIGHLSSSYTNIIHGGAFPESTPVIRK